MTKATYKNQNIAIWKINDRAKGIKSHYYLNESYCDGRMAALLPFRFGKGNRVEYLVRKELVPCWDMNRTSLVAITGTTDQRWREQKTGFFLSPISNRFKTLGSCYGIKRADTVYDLWAVNVHGLTQEPPEGDGTPVDDLSTCHWVVDSTIGMSVDPLVYILHYRTARYIRRLARPRARGATLKALAGIHA